MKEVIRQLTDNWHFTQDQENPNVYYKITEHSDFGIKCTVKDSDNMLLEQYLRIDDAERAFDDPSQYEQQVMFNIKDRDKLESILTDMFTNIIRNWVSKYLTPEEVAELFNEK